MTWDQSTERQGKKVMLDYVEIAVYANGIKVDFFFVVSYLSFCCCPTLTFFIMHLTPT